MASREEIISAFQCFNVESLIAEVIRARNMSLPLRIEHYPVPQF